MFSRAQLEKTNGASNSFFGWGGEDDDLWNRCQAANMSIIQAPKEQGQFHEENGNHKRDVNPDRYKILRRPNISSIMHSDGLKQVTYSLLKRHDYSTFVWMLVDV